MRGWNVNNVSTQSQETPLRPRFGTLAAESPKTIRVRKQAAVENAKESAKLPGFYNSFAASTPVRPSQTRKAKSKNRDRGEVMEVDWQVKGRTSLFGQPSQLLGTGPPPPSPPSSPTRHRPPSDAEMYSDDAFGYADDGPGDVGLGDMEMAVDGAEDSPSEQFDEVTLHNWKEDVRLFRLSLGHFPHILFHSFTELY